jgi:hypothetical protein
MYKELKLIYEYPYHQAVMDGSVKALKRYSIGLPNMVRLNWLGVILHAGVPTLVHNHTRPSIDPGA